MKAFSIMKSAFAFAAFFVSLGHADGYSDDDNAIDIDGQLSTEKVEVSLYFKKDDKKILVSRSYQRYNLRSTSLSNHFENRAASFTDTYVKL